MIDSKGLNQRSETVRELLRTKLGLRGKTLAAQLKRAGRRLPARHHRDGQVILSAQDRIVHPKLATTIDEAELNAAFAGLMNHLGAVDPKDRRKGKLLGWMGYQVFNLMVIAALLVAVLLWRGFIG